MKFTTTVAVATFVACAAAQLDKIPPCAQSCLLTGISATTCGTDIKCACSDASFVSGALTCAQKSCPADVFENAVQGAAGLCKSFGVTIPTTIPGSGPASTSAAPSSSAAASTEAPSTTEAPSSTEAATTDVSTAESSASASAPASYSVPAVSSASATATAPASYSVPAVTSKIATSTIASNGTVPTTAAPAPPAATNGAAALSAGALAAFGAVAAFFL